MVNSIKLLTHLNVLDNEVTTTLMGLYSDASPDLQELIISFFQLKGLDDPHNYFAKELDSSMSGASITDLIAKSTDWLDIWRKDYHSDSKQQLGVGGGGKGGSKGKGTHRKSSTLEVPPMYTNPIDVINYFVRLEHEKSLAKLKKDTPPPPPPPAEEEDTFTRNAVVPLPVLEQHGRLTRIGETHCSCCHPERETSLYLASLVAKQSNSWRTLRMAVRPQTINPFLSLEEKEEQLNRTNVGKLSLISNTRLFVIEHSYPHSNMN
ncbi:PREDICTED: uncharacterized protein LOC109585500 [Amphimedon queenslandica]|uniref:Uncharacterized protein n=1 Tax=Amphimedon queenslandica TaxID=400682 RepID=A0A1X7TX76_AMPQE|nr:PREDICTED: uncharacterized protein LOC109585500 [Amphimedon queenslandica]|eukprot:XP_019857172.1 PREDICTED: uncharacterized protein LOC109585500 [Amphimedon queenslandica]